MHQLWWIIGFCQVVLWLELDFKFCSDVEGVTITEFTHTYLVLAYMPRKKWQVIQVSDVVRCAKSLSYYCDWLLWIVILLDVLSHSNAIVIDCHGLLDTVAILIDCHGLLDALGDH